jgi:nucleotide-binding universal stress UspA family protein
MYAHIYRHALVPVDCTEECRRSAEALAEFFAPHQNCMVTLAATISPSQTPEERQKRVAHAESALAAIAAVFQRYGIYARRAVLEGSDPYVALQAKIHSVYRDEPMDLVVLTLRHTRNEEDVSPCLGSFADRIARRVAPAGLQTIILPV